MAMKITEKQYVTKQELCQICNISESTAYKLLKSKKLNFVLAFLFDFWYYVHVVLITLTEMTG